MGLEEQVVASEPEGATLDGVEGPRISPPNSKQSDFLEEHLSGDPEAFQQLVGLYETRLQRYFYRQCKDHNLAEDLAQELFMKLLRTNSNYEGKGCLDTFIYKMAKNLWIDKWRQIRVRPKFTSENSQDSEEEGLLSKMSCGRRGPEELAEMREDVQMLNEVVDSLDQAHREVIQRGSLQEQSHAEVSEELGIPVGTVKSRKFNALQKLLLEFQKKTA